LFPFPNAPSHPATPIFKNVWHFRNLRRPFSKSFGPCDTLFSRFHFNRFTNLRNSFSPNPVAVKL